MRISRIAGASVAATALTTVLAVPTAAAITSDTTVAFAVTAADLTISAPATATLPATVPGEATTGDLGTVTVEDNRAALDSSWVARATMDGPFTTGDASAAETIPAENATYDRTLDDYGPGSDFSTASPGTLDGSVAAVVHGTSSGNNWATWTPTLTVEIPPTVVAGTYTGTVVHSVA